MLSDERTLEPRLYRLPDEPVAAQVLIPGFRAATSVKGAFGWFTAGWIGQLAPGLALYLNRENAKPLEFTVAPALFPDERSAIERGVQMSDTQAAELVGHVFLRGRPTSGGLARHALDCLSWMIATNRLRLRIAVPTPESNYHPKLWLFDDGTNQVLARGSGNATGRGVAAGVEHLDVDVSWVADSAARVHTGLKTLSDWTKGESAGIHRVLDLPDALREDIIRAAPETAPRPADYERLIRPPNPLPAPAPLPVRRLRIPSGLEWRTGPYAHQGEAVEAWEGGEAPETGVIAMATGAGKTLTALICAARCQDRLKNHQAFLVVISAPSVPLVLQWRDEVKKFGMKAIAPSLGDVDRQLTQLFRSLRRGGTHVVVATNRLLCSARFQRTVEQKLRSAPEPVETMLIGDEAHTLGADSFVQNKPEFFQRRLALSATPERQYDPDGTEAIFDFFGKTAYEFGLDRAIGFCLVPYRYYVHACTLGGDELEEFERLSQRIGAAMASDDGDEAVRRLLIARRRIVETAQTKIDLLRVVLLRREPSELEHTLIYASAKRPSQFTDIGRVLTELGVRWSQVTQDTTAKPRLLARVLDSFTEGAIQVLLAKRVLDEGVDIPSVREAFIVASSTVEREWVQRRGRVLRMHPSKPRAIVHDFLGLPPVSVVRSDGNPSVAGIVRTELSRAQAFGRYAENLAGPNGVAADLERLTQAYWPLGGARPPLLSGPHEHWVATTTPKGRPW